MKLLVDPQHHKLRGYFTCAKYKMALTVVREHPDFGCLDSGTRCLDCEHYAHTLSPFGVEQIVSWAKMQQNEHSRHPSINISLAQLRELRPDLLEAPQPS